MIPVDVLSTPFALASKLPWGEGRAVGVVRSGWRVIPGGRFR